MAENISLREYVDIRLEQLKNLEGRLDRISSRITTIEAKQAGHGEVQNYLFALGGIIIAAGSMVALYLVR